MKANCSCVSGEHSFPSVVKCAHLDDGVTRGMNLGGFNSVSEAFKELVLGSRRGTVWISDFACTRDQD